MRTEASVEGRCSCKMLSGSGFDTIVVCCPVGFTWTAGPCTRWIMPAWSLGFCAGLRDIALAGSG